MSDCLDKLFREKAQWINVYLGVEVIDDPYEKSTSITLLPPKNIQAVVTDLTATQAHWKMPGIKVTRAKTILIKRQYVSLIENSYKIELKGDNHTVEEYEGWKELGQMQYRRIGDYLEINIYSKHA